ncbi:MAG: exo-alpha-sialidase, partial [Thermoguttaceae bacterium]|nr:exo-alpha-sialidase [Thermoguttaceae bacterium]
SAPFAQCHASTIEETAGGYLVAAWFGGTGEGDKDVKIWCSTCIDGKWTEPIIAADENNVPCWNPVLFQPSDGPLYLFYKVSDKIATWRGVYKTSIDNGRTWENRTMLPEGLIGPVKNKPIQLSDGTILSGSSTEHDGWIIHVERLLPDAEEWIKSPPLNDKAHGAIQPTLLRYADGRIQMICRPGSPWKNLWQLWSDDQGVTWGKMSGLPLPNPNSGIDAVTLRDGRQLLVYNHTNAQTTPKHREMLNVAVSVDGEQWEAVCKLEETPRCEFSYPAVIQSKDGLIHIVYTWKRTHIKHVVLDPEKIQGIPIVDEQWPDLEK